MKNLPIGIENFKELRDKDYYYVDKTDFIKDVWQEKVALYTRPQRFGKTLNMSMLYYFFSIRQKEQAYLFDGLKIMDEPDVADYQNQYPVIMISSKDMKHSSFAKQITLFSEMMSVEMEKNKELLFSKTLSEVMIPKGKRTAV